MEFAEIKDVAIPANVFVACPKTGNFSSVGVASHCVGCASFMGMIEVATGGPFAECYRVQCQHPMSRRITAVAL